MKTVLTGIALFCFAIMPALSAEPKLMTLHDAPRPLPEISFTDETGGSLTLNSYLGKVVLLNIWATWCAPCRTEMPTLDRLQARLGSDRFEVVALSIDRAGVGIVRKFYDETGIKHLKLVIDQNGRAMQALSLLGLPTTILVGPGGLELARHIGPAEWDLPEMRAFFEHAIKTQPTGKKRQ
jgi:thiol-disulfide isomerase/thioredoxin